MLFFMCPNCEAFSVGKAEDYIKFLDKHAEATCESFSYDALSHYMNNTTRLLLAYDQVGDVSEDALKSLLIKTFSDERDRLIAEIEKK